MAAFLQMKRGKQQGIQHVHYFLKQHLFPPKANIYSLPKPTVKAYLAWVILHQNFFKAKHPTPRAPQPGGTLV